MAHGPWLMAPLRHQILHLGASAVPCQLEVGRADCRGGKGQFLGCALAVLA